MRTRAFTLAEVLLAIGLLAIIALGLLGLFVSSRVSSQGSQDRVEAVNLASQELDRLKSKPYEDLAALLSTPMAPYQTNFRNKPYQVKVQVGRVDSDPLKLEYSLLELQLSVTWEQKDRLEQDGQKLGAGAAVRTVWLNTVVAPGSNQ